jgi:hypothetical protein
MLDFPEVLLCGLSHSRYLPSPTVLPLTPYFNFKSRKLAILAASSFILLLMGDWTLEEEATLTLGVFFMEKLDKTLAIC